MNPLATALATATRALRTEETRLASQLTTLQRAIAALGKSSARKAGPKNSHRLSNAGRAAISRAARKRWAAWHKVQRAASKKAKVAK
jgi:hypothetical protein